MQIRNTYRSIIRLALPISLSIFIPQINFLANTAFLGRVGEQELGVNGVAGVFYLTLAMIGYGLSNGLQVQMSRRAGEGDKAGLTRTFFNGVMLSVALSLTLMMLCLWLAPIIFTYSLRNASNMVMSIDFVYLRVWGLPLLMLTQLANAYFISVGKTRMLIYGAVAATATNIVLDYVLIFGYGGVPAMGLNGAALASVAAEGVGFVTMFALLLWRRRFALMRYIPMLHFNAAESWKSLKVAAPLIVQFLFSIGGWQLFFIWVEHLGQEELAASQVLRSVIGMVSIGCWALANTCNMMVSNTIGQGRQEDVPAVIGKVVVVSAVYALIVCSLLLLFSRQFIMLYRNDEVFATFMMPAMRVVTLAAFIMALATVVFNGVVGTGNTRVNLLIEITCVSLYILYCYVVIEQRGMSLAWAWGSDFVYWSTLLLCSLGYLWWGGWRGKKV